MLFANKNHMTPADDESNQQVNADLQTVASESQTESDFFEFDFDDDLADFEIFSNEEEEKDTNKRKNTEIVDKDENVYDLKSMRRGSIVQFTDKREEFENLDPNRFMVISHIGGQAVWISDNGILYDSEGVARKSRNYNYETTIIHLDSVIDPD